MKVRDLMQREPVVCSPRDSLASAAMKMWSGDFGVVPVVDEGRLLGMITDRDISMAAAIQGRSPGEIPVEQVFSKSPATCLADDDVGGALDAMGSRQVRRLPVVDENGRLEGIVSLNDMVLAARASSGRRGTPTYAQVIQALQGICEHRPAAVAAP